MIDTSRSGSFIVPSVQSTDTVRANADLLRRVAAAIGLTGATLVEVCERIILSSETGSTSIGRRQELTVSDVPAARSEAPSEAVRDG